jgi:SAM-dependent methyltransferase
MLTPHERYLFKPFNGSSHFWALGELSSTPSSISVLDIGAGSGAIGKTLKEQGTLELYAVEIDAATREHIAPIYKQVFNALEDVPASLQVDVLLLLDVLEHTTEPKLFLERAVKHLKPGGKIYISVPNIAHWSIRLSLLFGVFNYTSRGLLDKTHFHFFTRSHLLEMISSLGALEISASSASISPLELLSPEPLTNSLIFKWFASFRLAMAQVLPGLLGYQILVMATKK